jgi:hypothetical protein
MSSEGPSLQELTHRLSECPSDFLAEPIIGSTGVIDSAAVVSDLSRALGGTLLGARELAKFQHKNKSDRNRIRIALVASWLLYGPWFRAEKKHAKAAVAFLSDGLDDLAPLVEAPLFVSDADRREELVRLALGALDLRPAGESEAQAADRLTTLSSAERSRVIRETRAAQERVREIREAMKKKAAEEAAASYGRE